MIAPDVEAKLRSSVVSLRLGDGSSGTTWIAGDNGVAVSAVRLVRWFSDGRIVSANGELEIMARAIHLDLGSEVALLLPPFRIGLPAVTLGDDRGAKVGQPVFAVGSGLSAIGGTIAAITPSRFELNATLGPELLGAPLIDERGLVIGVVIRTEGRPSGLPISALLPILQHHQGEAGELFGRLPYRCGTCRTMFARSDDRCPGCGVVPSFGGAAPAPDLAMIQGARQLGASLARLGQDPTASRVAADRWQLDEITVALEEGSVRLTIPVQSVPPDNHDACYRFLLTYADVASDHLAVGIKGDDIVLQTIEPLVALGDRDLGARLQQLRDGAFRLRQTLPKALSGEAPVEAEPQPAPIQVIVGERIELDLEEGEAEPLQLEGEALQPLSPEAALALDLDDDLSLP